MNSEFDVVILYVLWLLIWNLQGINIREMLAGASLMDEANRTTAVRICLKSLFLIILVV